MPDAQPILGEIADLYAHADVGDGMLQAAAAQLRRLAGSPPAAEKRLTVPVHEHLAAALKAASRGPLAGIAKAFAAIEPSCRWRQNPNYTVATLGERFMDNYGYVELVGGDRRWASDSIAVGFLLLGPGVEYPAHSHPAAEVYHVVSGIAAWRRGTEPLAVRMPGAAIHHAPNVVHLTRTAAEPLLALYCWSGAIATAARLA